MNAKIDAFSQAEFKAALAAHIKELLIKPSASPSEDSPCAFLLGGQSGAGKTTLHDIISDELNKNAIVINGDEYRRSHPRFAQIQSRYGMDAPAHTAQWSGQMTEALINTFSERRYNLVVEGTLRTSAVPLKTAELLRSRGYDVYLAIMAVKPEISLVSCQIRYEMMRIAGTTPRATDPNHHNQIVHDIVDNLAVLEKSGAFSDIRLYDRSARCLYPADGEASASEVLERALFGPWSEEEEEHLKFLRQKLADVTASAEA